MKITLADVSPKKIAQVTILSLATLLAPKDSYAAQVTGSNNPPPPGLNNDSKSAQTIDQILAERQAILRNSAALLGEKVPDILVHAIVPRKASTILAGSQTANNELKKVGRFAVHCLTTKSQELQLASERLRIGGNDNAALEAFNKISADYQTLQGNVTQIVSWVSPEAAKFCDKVFKAGDTVRSVAGLLKGGLGSALSASSLLSGAGFANLVFAGIGASQDEARHEQVMTRLGEISDQVDRLGSDMRANQKQLINQLNLIQDSLNGITVALDAIDSKILKTYYMLIDFQNDVIQQFDAVHRENQQLFDLIQEVEKRAEVRALREYRVNFERARSAGEDLKNRSTKLQNAISDQLMATYYSTADVDSTMWVGTENLINDGSLNRAASLINVNEAQHNAALLLASTGITVPNVNGVDDKLRNPEIWYDAVEAAIHIPSNSKWPKGATRLNSDRRNTLRKQAEGINEVARVLGSDGLKKMIALYQDVLLKISIEVGNLVRKNLSESAKFPSRLEISKDSSQLDLSVSKRPEWKTLLPVESPINGKITAWFGGTHPVRVSKKDPAYFNSRSIEGLTVNGLLNIAVPSKDISFVPNNSLRLPVSLLTQLPGIELGYFANPIDPGLEHLTSLGQSRIEYWIEIRAAGSREPPVTKRVNKVNVATIKFLIEVDVPISARTTPVMEFSVATKGSKVPLLQAKIYKSHITFPFANYLMTAYNRGVGIEDPGPGSDLLSVESGWTIEKQATATIKSSAANTFSQITSGYAAEFESNLSWAIRELKQALTQDHYSRMSTVNFVSSKTINVTVDGKVLTITPSAPAPYLLYFELVLPAHKGSSTATTLNQAFDTTILQQRSLLAKMLAAEASKDLSTNNRLAFQLKELQGARKLAQACAMYGAQSVLSTPCKTEDGTYASLSDLLFGSDSLISTDDIKIIFNRVDWSQTDPETLVTELISKEFAKAQRTKEVLNHILTDPVLNKELGIARIKIATQWLKPK